MSSSFFAVDFRSDEYLFRRAEAMEYEVFESIGIVTEDRAPDVSRDPFYDRWRESSIFIVCTNGGQIVATVRCLRGAWEELTMSSLDTFAYIGGECWEIAALASRPSEDPNRRNLLLATIVLAARLGLSYPEVATFVASPQPRLELRMRELLGGHATYQPIGPVQDLGGSECIPVASSRAEVERTFSKFAAFFDSIPLGMLETDSLRRWSTQ